MNTKDKGSISEAMVLACFVRKGYKVSIPWGENCAYDLVIDVDGQLKRVQVKTGRLRSCRILFNLGSVHYSAAIGKFKAFDINIENIDLFAVYCPDNQKIYLIPVSILKTKTQCSLSFIKDSRSLMAADFEIG